MYGKMRNAYKILVGKSQGERPLGRSRHRKDNIKIDLGEIRLEDVDWIYVVSSCEHGCETSGSIKAGEFLY
jgi:hypothetical protein